MKLKLTIIIFLFSGLYVTLQAQGDKLIKADKFFDKYDYYKAIKLYTDLATNNYKSTSKEYVSTRLGDSYRLINDPVNAELWYRIAVNFDKCDSKTYYYLAQVLQSNQKYDEIPRWMNKYLETKPKEFAGVKELASFTDYDKFIADSNNIYVKPMTQVNSNKADFSPAFVKGRIVFVSSRNTVSARRSVWTEEPFYSLYECEIDSNYNLKSQKKLFGDVNTRFHEGPMSYHEKSGILYFTRNNFVDRKKKSSKDNTNFLKVYQAEYVDSSWRNIEELPFNNDDFTCAHPAISPDGNKLYFISNMPGGLGGTDIYYCEKNVGVWSEPINAGTPVNTAGNELFPSFSHNGNLYFASNGHPGLGGLDLFVYKDGKVENIGYPVNTNYDDFGLTTLNDKKGFFSSNRNGGINNDDLYYFRVNDPPVAENDELFIEIVQGNYDVRPFQLKLLVNDADKNNDIDTAKTKLLFANDNQRISKVDSSGMFHYKPQDGFLGVDTFKYVIFDKTNLVDTALVLVHVKAKNPPTAVVDSFRFEKNSSHNPIYVLSNDFDVDNNLLKDSVSVLSIPKHGTIEHINDSIWYTPEKDFCGTDYLIYKNYDLTGLYDADTVFIDVYNSFMKQKISSGFELNLIINFHTARWDITPQSALILDSLVTALNDYPDLKFELGAHTDSRGSARSNQILSQRRAESAVNYLIKRGIDKERLRAKGYGESQLTNKCADGVPCSPQEHAINRRVTIRMIKD